MRYAEPLDGRRCFRHPHDPEDENDLQSAQASGDLCLVTGFPADDSGRSEDWLFTHVQASSKAKEKADLPVFVYIAGDEYEGTLAGSNMNVMHLLESNGVNFVKLVHWERWKSQRRSRLAFRNGGEAKVEESGHLRWSCSF